KSYDHIRQKVNDAGINDFIREQKENHPIQTMCNMRDVSRSPYYQSLDQTISKRERENHELTKKTIKIHNESNKRLRCTANSSLLTETRLSGSYYTCSAFNIINSLL